MELAGINQEKTTKIVDANYDNSKMDKDEFLKVLLADIKWQNPMDVNDINDFINNSVKLREIEILNSFEDTINTLRELNGSNSLLMASNLIGKKIIYEGNQTYIENGKGQITFQLEDFAEKVKVSIVDKNGNLVEEKKFEFLNAGENYSLEIDNPQLEDGYYTVYIDAYKGKEKIDTKTISTAYVEGALKEDNQIKVIFSGISIPIDKIKQIGG
ncbi:MAG: flagellar hook capping protein [Aquificae bacterium]|nr:flagellar hook capping protein [Aquificota bacterium]